MNVLIVAKTRHGSGACIGGITFDGRSVYAYFNNDTLGYAVEDAQTLRNLSKEVV